MKTAVRETLMRAVFFAAAFVSVAAVVLICVFLFFNGIPGMVKIGTWDFLSGTTWRPDDNIYGIFPMILGSIYVTAVALVIGVPSGIMCAVYMARFCPPVLYRFFKPAVDLLAGGLKEKPAVILTGGPMTGTVQTDLEVPVVKNTNALLCLTA